MRLNQSTARMIVVVGAWVISPGCVRELPPHRPSPVVPEIDIPTQSPRPGNGRVVLEVVDGPATVMEIRHDVYQMSEEIPVGTSVVERQDLCSTPCVLERPLGRSTLRLTLQGDPSRNEVHSVTFSETSRVFLFALEERTERRGLRLLAIALDGLGAMLAVAGGAVIGVLIAEHENDTSLIGVGSGLIGAGAVTLASGIVLHAVFPPQRRRGAVTSFPLHQQQRQTAHNSRRSL